MTQERDSEFAHAPVSAYAKQSFWRIAFVMVGFTFFSPSMIAGGKLALGLSASSFILAIILGNLFLAFYTGLLAYISQKTALNLDLLAQHSFGRYGSYAVSALISLTQMGWFGVGVAMLALPLSSYLPAAIMGLPTQWILVIIIGIAMTATAAMGIRALAIFGTIAVPLILILGLISNGISIHEVGGFSGLFANSSQSMSMAAALSLVIGSFISGGSATPNFARFGKSPKIAVSATILAFFIGNIIMFSFGAIGAASYGEADIFNVLIIQGLIIPAILTLGLNIWSTNNNALYTCGLGFAHISKTSPKICTVLAGICGTFLSLYLYHNFVDYLSLLGSMIPPIGIIIILHFARHKKNYGFNREELLAVKFPALAGLLAGILGGNLINFGIAPVNSLICAALCFLILDILCNEDKGDKVKGD